MFSGGIECNCGKKWVKLDYTNVLNFSFICAIRVSLDALGIKKVGVGFSSLLIRVIRVLVHAQFVKKWDQFSMHEKRRRSSKSRTSILNVLVKMNDSQNDSQRIKLCLDYYVWIAICLSVKLS